MITNDVITETGGEIQVPVITLGKGKYVITRAYFLV